MRREDHAHALVPGQVADQFQHRDAALRIQTAGGLIQEKPDRIVDQGLGQLQALLHALAVVVALAVALVGQPHVVQDFVSALHGVARRHSRQLAEIGHESHAADARDDAAALGHPAQSRASETRLSRHVAIEHFHLPRGQGHLAQQAAQQRRLARTVGSEQAHGARLEGEVHPFEHGVPQVGEVQVPDFDPGLVTIESDDDSFPSGSGRERSRRWSE